MARSRCLPPWSVADRTRWGQASLVSTGPTRVSSRRKKGGGFASIGRSERHRGTRRGRDIRRPAPTGPDPGEPAAQRPHPHPAGHPCPRAGGHDRARTQNRRHRPAGTYLGLAIAAAIAQSHGGRLELDAVPGEGCTFRLVLPAADFGQGR
ncbi:ATP-binding protein [Streptomyces bicolor]|uniref:ATP-binding protein n=1 Tax=Streptomyces bicolor TaxID=66874 RepID=UPI003CC80A8F